MKHVAHDQMMTPNTSLPTLRDQCDTGLFNEWPQKRKGHWQGIMETRPVCPIKYWIIDWKPCLHQSSLQLAPHDSSSSSFSNTLQHHLLPDDDGDRRDVMQRRKMRMIINKTYSIIFPAAWACSYPGKGFGCSACDVDPEDSRLGGFGARRRVLSRPIWDVTWERLARGTTSAT